MGLSSSGPCNPEGSGAPFSFFSSHEGGEVRKGKMVGTVRCGATEDDTKSISMAWNKEEIPGRVMRGRHVPVRAAETQNRQTPTLVTTGRSQFLLTGSW